MQQLGRATLARALFSKRQLFEVMVEFWSNHFNVTTPSGDVWDLKTGRRPRGHPQERARQFQRHAAGQRARAPPCSTYLNNATAASTPSTRTTAARLLELHTVGIDAGYTHAEVIDSARIMTGYTVGVHGEFAYYNDWHYVGPVKVLGFSAPNADEFAGLHAAAAVPELPRQPPEHRAAPGDQARHPLRLGHPAAVADRHAGQRLPRQQHGDRARAESPFHVSRIRRQHRAEDPAAHRRRDRRRPDAGRHPGRRRRQQPGRALLAARARWVRRRSPGTRRTAIPMSPAPGCPPAARCGAGTPTSGLVGGWWTDGMATPAPTTLLGATPPATIGGVIDALSLRLIGVKLTGAQRVGDRQLRLLAHRRLDREHVVGQHHPLGPGCRHQPDPQHPELDRAMSIRRPRPAFLRRRLPGRTTAASADRCAPRRGLTRRGMLAAMGVTAGAVAVSPLARVSPSRPTPPTPATSSSCCRCTAGGTRLSVDPTDRRSRLREAATHCRHPVQPGDSGRRHLRPASGTRAAEAVLRQRPVRRRPRRRHADRRPQPLPGRVRTRTGRAGIRRPDRWLDRVLDVRGPGTAFQARRTRLRACCPNSLIGPAPSMALNNIADFSLSIWSGYQPALRHRARRRCTPASPTPSPSRPPSRSAALIDDHSHADRRLHPGRRASPTRRAHLGNALQGPGLGDQEQHRPADRLPRLRQLGHAHRHRQARRHQRLDAPPARRRRRLPGGLRQGPRARRSPTSTS